MLLDGRMLGFPLVIVVGLAGCEVPRRPDLAMSDRPSGCDGLPEDELFGGIPDRSSLAAGSKLESGADGVAVLLPETGDRVVYGPGVPETVSADGKSVLIGQPSSRPDVRTDPEWLPATGGRVQWSVPAEWWSPSSNERLPLTPAPGCRGPRAWSPDGRYYTALEHVRGEVRNSQPVAVTLCDAAGQVRDAFELGMASDGSPTVDVGGRLVLSVEWGPGSNAVLAKRRRVGSKGGAGVPAVYAVQDDRFVPLAVDTTLVSFTEDGQALLQYSAHGGCRLFPFGSGAWRVLGGEPVPELRGHGKSQPWHQGCRSCGASGAVSVQEDPAEPVRMYDTSGRFLYQSSSTGG